MANHKHFQLGIKALIQNKQEKILLIQKNSKDIKSFELPAYWDLPGGRIEEGDTIESTLKKELKEELGIDSFVNKGIYSSLVSNIEITKENCGLILFVYKCIIDEGSKIILSDEHTNLKWADKKEAATLLSIKYPKDFTLKIFNPKKLVRDNIPEIIISTGEKPVIHTANQEEYTKEVSIKLLEEVNEFLTNPSIEEMADIYEVLDAVKEIFEFSENELSEIKNKKAIKNGKFKKRIILDDILPKES